MLINPYETALPCWAGMRRIILPEEVDAAQRQQLAIPFDLDGVGGLPIPDTVNVHRVWTVEALYAPIPGRAIGGVRIKLRDQHDYVTFCNQRDFEVLVGAGRPGEECLWLGRDYVPPNDREWFGFCCDEEDLRDELYENEINTRLTNPALLVPGFGFTRRVHLSAGLDLEEDFFFIQDNSFGTFPDTRFETVERRWVRSERRKIRWKP